MDERYRVVSLDLAVRLMEAMESEDIDAERVVEFARVFESYLLEPETPAKPKVSESVSEKRRQAAKKWWSNASEAERKARGDKIRESRMARSRAGVIHQAAE